MFFSKQSSVWYLQKKNWQLEFYFVVVASQFFECWKRSKSLVHLTPWFNLCLKTKKMLFNSYEFNITMIFLSSCFLTLCKEMIALLCFSWGLKCPYFDLFRSRTDWLVLSFSLYYPQAVYIRKKNAVLLTGFGFT